MATSLLIYISFNSIHSSCRISPISLPNQHILQSAYISSQNTAYTFGSYESTNPNVYKYDISSSTQGFIQIGTTPVPHFFSYANGVAVIDNLVYFIGVDRTDEAVHIFDTIRDSWANNDDIASPPTPAIDACVANNQTHIFSVGGASDTLQIYDISKNIWSQSTINISAITGHRYWGQMCWMVHDVLYVFGGSVGDGWHSSTSNIYKWKEDTGWSSVGDLPHAISTVRAEKHPLDNNIFIIGGFPPSDAIYKFNVNTERITDTFHLVSAIDDFATDFVGDALYVWGSRFYPTQIQICTGLFANATNKLFTTTDIDSTITPSTSWYTSSMNSITDNHQPYYYENGDVEALQRVVTIVITVAVVIVFISVAIIGILSKRKRRSTFTYDSVADKKDKNNEDRLNMLENDAINKSVEFSMLCDKDLALNIEQHEYELEDGTKKIRLQLSVEPKEENEDEQKQAFVPGKKSSEVAAEAFDGSRTPHDGPENTFCSLCGGLIFGAAVKSNDLSYCALCWENEDRSLSDENENLYCGTNPEVEGEYLTTNENVTRTNDGTEGNDDPNTVTAHHIGN